MQVDHDALIEAIMWRGGIPDRARAEAAVAAALGALGLHLRAPDRAFIAEQLPVPLATAVLRPGPAAASRPSDLYQQLATTEAINLGLSVEHAKAACSGVAEWLDGEARSLLARRLPPPWAELFTPVAVAAESDVPAGTVPGHGRTIATGRPGSRRPLAEATPPAAQSDSVVTTDNPHADRKLSSAAEPDGASQLATARPGAEYPIAQAKDERPRR
jgi:hypothetical protein